MTLAIFKLSGKIPVVKETLHIKQCSAFCFLGNINIFIGMLFISVALLLLRLDIIARTYFFVQEDVRNYFPQDSVKKWWKNLKVRFILDWIVDATEKRKINKIFGNVFWVSKDFALVVKNYFRTFRFFSVLRKFLV